MYQNTKFQRHGYRFMMKIYQKSVLNRFNYLKFSYIFICFRVLIDICQLESFIKLKENYLLSLCTSYD